MSRDANTTQSDSVCLGCGARGRALAQDAHRNVCEYADVVPAEGATSWERCRDEPGRWAAADAAQAVAAGLAMLMASSRKRGRTIQWMPDENGYGCRFEVIEVKSGDYLGVVRIDNQGRVTVTDG